MTLLTWLYDIYIYIWYCTTCLLIGLELSSQTWCLSDLRDSIGNQVNTVGVTWRAHPRIVVLLSDRRHLDTSWMGLELFWISFKKERIGNLIGLIGLLGSGLTKFNSLDCPHRAWRSRSRRDPIRIVLDLHRASPTLLNIRRMIGRVLLEEIHQVIGHGSSGSRGSHFGLMESLTTVSWHGWHVSCVVSSVELACLVYWEHIQILDVDDGQGHVGGGGTLGTLGAQDLCLEGWDIRRDEVSVHQMRRQW